MAKYILYGLDLLKSILFKLLVYLSLYLLPVLLYSIATGNYIDLMIIPFTKVYFWTMIIIFLILRIRVL